MIPFTCRCGHAFSVNDELAGGLVQCPQCKRLNDVPLLSDLDSLDDQGIFKLDEGPKRTSDNPKRLAELTTIYTREHFDLDGNPLDLRGDFSQGHGGPVPVESLGKLDKTPPRYDPITGELIRDIDVKPEIKPDPRGLPVARKVVVAPTQISGIDIPKPGEAWLIPARLLRPVNLLVMFFILLAHLFAAMMMAAIAAFYWVLAPFWAILHLLIVSHYGNVIDETGPTSKTDLPTPLRNLDWHEDTWGPFKRIMWAVLVCYGPGVLLLPSLDSVPPQMLLPLSGALIGIGTVLFPAAVLTTLTSGSLANLRPDRLFAVLYVIGVEYCMLLLFWVAGGLLLAYGVTGSTWLGAAIFRPDAHPPEWLTWPASLGALAGATYLMHLACCYLGLLYRKHHAAFPWLYQRFTGRRKRDQALGFPVGKPPPKGIGPPPRNQFNTTHHSRSLFEA